MEADARHTVKIVYAGTPRTVAAPSSRTDVDALGWHTRGDGQVWAMQEPFGAYTWYPVNDQPSDKAFYDVRVNVPQPWVGVSNGKMTRRFSANGRVITQFTNTDPMASYLTTIAIGPYRHYKQTGPHGLPISYWVPRSSPEMVKPLRQTPDALRFLEARLGRYPFDRAGVVVTPGDSAMETQTLISFGRGNYRYGASDVRRTIVHELAHAWYGDTVTPLDWRDMWMNEGMATYLETRFAVARGWTTWRSWQHQWARDDQFWRNLYGPPGRYDPQYFAADERLLLHRADAGPAAHQAGHRHVQPADADLAPGAPQHHPGSHQLPAVAGGQDGPGSPKVLHQVADLDEVTGREEATGLSPPGAHLVGQERHREAIWASQPETIGNT